MALDGIGSVYDDTGWYLVVLGRYKLALLGIRWYRVSIGLLCLYTYIGKSGDLVGFYRSLIHTHRQTTEDRATQLVYSIKFKLSHAIFLNCDSQLQLLSS